MTSGATRRTVNSCGSRADGQPIDRAADHVGLLTGDDDLRLGERGHRAPGRSAGPASRQAGADPAALVDPAESR